MSEPNLDLQLQLENITTCSARCTFCVYPQVMAERAGQAMPMDLHRKIIDEAATIPQFTKVTITGLSEPTLDPLLEDRIAYVKEKMPNVHTEIFTNGAHLTPKRHDSLRVAGLDGIIVSLNAVRPEQHEAIMGLKGCFNRVCTNLDYAIENRAGKAIEVHAVVNNDTFVREDSADFKIRWGRFGVLIWESNWAGEIRTLREFKPNEHCFRATTSIYVQWDGKINTCCFDPTGKMQLGDLTKETLREAYNRDPYLQFREDHANNQADKYSICRTCSRI